ncbi:hypothetical protein FB548_1693 [Pseudoxanthomonas sp. 3HH-4]|uniref:hypothetical protein n=1 Tax=Pseudoxanthomonas sp. 3HH-4 TaxID=1690214 RepID=UPI001153A97D|nr:hypothetical protein [Pseudoxanthomonas sp. 3HH-4]TQM12842.1 hypothetical protein FB548_1693 [Pseudoxanthomonas sp. 3HH-4]
MRATPSRLKTHGIPSAVLLTLALLAAAIGHCGAADAPEASAAQEPRATQASAEAPQATAAPAPPPAPAGTDQLKIDLTFVDRRSPEYGRFRNWVDTAVSGSPGYAFSASDAALMFLLSDGEKYCKLAVRMVEKEVAEAEAAIAAGSRPAIAGDSYLEVGPRIADLAMTLHACTSMIDAAQRQRWSALAEQAVWNLWNPSRAQWGGRTHAWTGWSIDNPGNNYYYSFIEATMYWALVSGSKTWMDELKMRRLPPLKAYYAELPGGGSREGTGYGAAQMRLFGLYRLWKDSTGEDLATSSTHARDSIPYWIHATVPTLDRFAPIGDQARSSIPELFDYHRRLVLEARQLTTDADARAMSSWWLRSISVPRMSQGFNSRYDLLPTGDGGDPPPALVYHAEGAGHLFARSDWGKDAMWMSFVAGPYNESHAHQEQGGFTLFARDWLAVTENIWSHSGIQQGTPVHNVVRFERANADAQQCAAPRGDVVVHQCETPRSRSRVTVTPRPDGGITATADLTPVYRDNPALQSWQRRIEFGGRKLLVQDDFRLGTGTRAIFQVNVPERPTVQGNEAIAGRLRIRVLEPADATLRVHTWSDDDAQEFRRGWRVDVSGGQTGYKVELSEK